MLHVGHITSEYGPVQAALARKGRCRQVRWIGYNLAQGTTALQMTDAIHLRHLITCLL